MSVSTRCSSLAAAALLFAISSTASASLDIPNFSYTSLSVGPHITSYSADTQLPNLLGIGAGASLQFSPNWYIEIDLRQSEGNDTVIDVDVFEGLAALGYVTPIVGDADFFMQLGAAYGRAEVCDWRACATESDTGLAGRLGVRAWVSDAFELTGSIDHDSTGEGQTRFNLGMAGWLDVNSSLYLNMEIEQDYTQISGGYRYTF